MPLASKRLRGAAKRVPGVLPVYAAMAKRRLLRRGVGRLDYEGAPIDVRVSSMKIITLRLRSVAKEPWTVAWIERTIRPGDVLYDIGANIGAYALIAAKASAGAARVVAFEPAAANFAELCENVVLNGMEDVVLPLPVVLGERRRLGTFAHSTLQPGAALHELDTERSTVYRQPVLVHALDELIEAFELPPPTLVKLDVDGSETRVLAGATRTLARPELRSLLVEVDEAQTNGVLTAVGEAGLRLVERVDERGGEPLPGVWYGVFERDPG